VSTTVKSSQETNIIIRAYNKYLQLPFE